MTKESPVSDKAQRREEARQKALQLQQEQLKREKRSRLIILSAIVVGAILLGGLIYFILSKAPSDLAGIEKLPSDVTAPAVAEADGAIIFAADGVDEATTPVLDVYLDFMCNHCATFEQVNAEYIGKAVADGDIIYRAHPISILGSQHATKIASTFVALADTATQEQALAFATEGFARQNSAGLTAQQMQDIAVSLGVDEKVAKEAASGKYERFIEAASQITLNNKSLRDEKGDFGTPSVFINGERSDVNWSDPAGLPAAIQTAAEAMVEGPATE